ncbi:MAG: pyridoxine 5'-phosphate synthase [Polyangiaceae bacterium]|nr:pyridoxine 5'-phosphate synthase [Polyangiaceae bacterium]
MRLHVNVDHVATVRNARGTPYPDPVLAAQLAELAGADGITAHLREDRRHIVDDDVVRLRRSVTTLLNLELAATEEMLAVATRVRPDVVTLVPERREERTTEGGLDVCGGRESIRRFVAGCAGAGVETSLFVEAEARQIEAARAVGAVQVELHTGTFCEARGVARERELERLVRAARVGVELGLRVAAGHGLNRQNVGPIARVAEITEVNIGHSVIADAVLIGIDRAVRDLAHAISAARHGAWRGAATGGRG